MVSSWIYVIGVLILCLILWDTHRVAEESSSSSQTISPMKVRCKQCGLQMDGEAWLKQPNYCVNPECKMSKTKRRNKPDYIKKEPAENTRTPKQQAGTVIMEDVSTKSYIPIATKEAHLVLDVPVGIAIHIRP